MPAGDRPSSPPDTLASLRRRSRLKRPFQSDLFTLELDPGIAHAASAKALAPDRIGVGDNDLESRTPPPATRRDGVSESRSERRIYTVRSLVAHIRLHTESAYADIWVEGEISNCRPAASGHIYFTLKDGEAQLPIVLFRSRNQLLRFKPTDGLAVLVRGRISIYESRGQLQLIAETMEPRGAGALQLAFEQLKKRLAAEGLFDASRKRPLPTFPHCIGVITSPSGAVVRDIVTVVRRRHACLNLLIYPAVMQGATSPSSVIAAIRWFNAHPERTDLILIARGGGSLEDLFAFNDESLVRAIAASRLPIVSAIGHETDFTISDFVADLRAPTPSAAAELITAAQHRIEDRVAALSLRLNRGIVFNVMQSRARYSRLSADSVLSRLRDSLYRHEQHLDDLNDRAESAMQRVFRTPTMRLKILTDRLRLQAPIARLTAAHRRLARAQEALTRTSTRLLTARNSRLATAATRLEALSPLAVLSRGYALVYAIPSADAGAPHLASEMWDPPLSDQPLGKEVLLRSSADIKPGQQIRARLATGSITAAVLATQMENHE